MCEEIEVYYEWTDNYKQAKEWLENLPDLFSADFETASMYYKKEKKKFEEELKLLNPASNDAIHLRQKIESDGLFHPSLSTVTHLSLGVSECKAYVIVCVNGLNKLVFNFLVETYRKQIWHNTMFDLSHIYYHTNKIPKNYEDTMLLAKSLLNNADSSKDRVKLKELMGYAYGDWAISKDLFVLEEAYEERTLKYSAIDACATYKLYQDILINLGVKEL